MYNTHLPFFTVGFGTLLAMCIYTSPYVYTHLPLFPSSVVPSVCGDDEGESGGAPGCLPQTDWLWETAHVCGDGECPLRLPATGETVHVTSDYQDLKHTGGPGDTASLLQSGQPHFICH